MEEGISALQRAVFFYLNGKSLDSVIEERDFYASLGEVNRPNRFDFPTFVSLGSAVLSLVLANPVYLSGILCGEAYRGLLFCRDRVKREDINRNEERIAREFATKDSKPREE